MVSIFLSPISAAAFVTLDCFILTGSVIFSFTGLLIVYDGTDRYEIRFSGDLKKSAAIIFRRKEGPL